MKNCTLLCVFVTWLMSLVFVGSRCGGEAVSDVSSGRPGSLKPPNIVFVLADDLGWSDLGCYGSDLHRTPHLDQLAAEGLRFTQAYAAAPVCTPTRASIMTGKTPARLHMTIWSEASQLPPLNRALVPPVTVGDLPHEEVTIAEALQNKGYRTAHIGKWHLGDAAHYPEAHGFEVNIGGTMWGAPNTFYHPFNGGGTFGDEFRYVPGLGLGTSDDYLTDRFTDEAIEIIDQLADGDQPFFLHMSYHTVHTPIEGKPEVVSDYQGRVRAGFHHRNAEYAAMVHSLDENVGRLIAALRQRRIAGDTIVIFTSDNGGFVNKYEETEVTNNWPLRSGKGSLYEGGVRVPLVVYWPGVTPVGGTCEEAVSSIDFYPTIAEIAGLDLRNTQDVDGLSLVPLLRQSAAEFPRDTLYWHYPHYYPTTTPVSAIRQGDWKLLEYFEDGHVELYNLADDQGETRNLAEQSPQRAAELRKKLAAWRQSAKAQLPKANR